METLKIHDLISGKGIGDIDDDEEEELRPDLMADDDSEISGEDDDDESEVDDLEEKHANLLESIKAMASEKKGKIEERTIGSTDVSEFGFSRTDIDSKVKLNDLLKSLRGANQANKLKKQIASIENVKIADIPLEKPQRERLTRSVAYKSTTDEISKWQPLIYKNRKAEQLSFPLQQPTHTMVTSDEMTKRFQPRTPLEREIAMLLHGSENVERNTKMLTKAEERALKAMSLEEARERRAELMKFRALMSYSESKFNRQKKIKSKRFHKILRKEKLKREEKELDSLQKTDPEAYLEKLEYVEKARVEERMSLKHRGGSKFAKKKMMYARYDPVARQAVQDMIEKNKELTKKRYVSSDEDSEGDDSMNEGEGFDLSTILDATANNPWMKAPSKQSEFIRPKKISQAKTGKAVQESESEEDEMFSLKNATRSDVNFLDLEAKRRQKLKRKKQELEVSEDKSKIETEQNADLVSENEELEKKLSESIHKEESNPTPKKSQKKNKKRDKSSTRSKEADEEVHNNRLETADGNRDNNSSSMDNKHIDELFDILEMKEERQAKQKLSKKEKKQMKQKLKNAEKIKNQKNEKEDEEMVSEEPITQSTTRKRTMEEFEKNVSDEEQIPEKMKKENIPEIPAKKKDIKNISVDPKKVFTIEADVIKTKVKPEVVTNDDYEDDGFVSDDDDDQRMTIAQAFADDDVIEEFRLEKRDVVDEDKPKEINLVLPGWGDWGGDGIQLSKKKVKKYTIKKKGAKRKDAKRGNVILNEKKDLAVAEHQVKDLPRQFLNIKQFEQSIRQPIGNTWNPEKAFHRMIQPKVVTTKGTIIKPMDKEEMFKKQKINQKGGGELGKSQVDSRSKVAKKQKINKFNKKLKK